MSPYPSSFLNAAGLDLAALTALQEKPAPFTPGEPLFWDDPHISKGMLAAHLDPHVEAASRRSETIERTVDWIVAALDLKPGAAVLDLGCGPGLYAQRLARRGLRVTGVDYSRRSIAYAREQAEKLGLDIVYRYENYLDLPDEDAYDAVLLIYGDFCPLNPEQRARLLANVHRALRPGGAFVLDVSTPLHHQRWGSRKTWSAAESGFWRPGPHLVLAQGFDYPEDIHLDQYIVIDADGALRVYRNWFQDYTPQRIRAELEAGGFEVLGLWGDLMGTPLDEDTEWIGVLARRGSGG